MFPFLEPIIVQKRDLSWVRDAQHLVIAHIFALPD